MPLATTARSSRRSRKTFCAAGPRAPTSLCPRQRRPARKRRRRLPSSGVRPIRTRPSRTWPPRARAPASRSRPRPRRDRRRHSSVRRRPTTSYQSNSWRQARPETARALSFSSGVLAPSSGLDPALKAHADGLRAQGRQFVYGFLLLRVPPDEALEKNAGRPRRPAPRSPRRPPQGPPAGRIARGGRRAARRRVGRGERAGAKAELGADRAAWPAGARRPGRLRDRPTDRHQSLRGRRERQLPAAARSGRGRDRGVRPRAPLLSRGGHRGRPSTRSPPSTSCCSSS